MFLLDEYCLVTLEFYGHYQIRHTESIEKKKHKKRFLNFIQMKYSKRTKPVGIESHNFLQIK
jgi:hypothetical protein